MLIDMDSLRGKCYIAGIVLIFAFFIFIIIALISSPNRRDDDDALVVSNTTSNDTVLDDLLRPSIAHYANNRDRVGIDKNGQLKEKWRMNRRR